MNTDDDAGTSRIMWLPYVRTPSAPTAEEIAAGHVVECPDCFALVRVERLPGHEYWHDQQTRQWRRDHLAEP